MSAEIQLKREASAAADSIPSKRKRQTSKTRKCCCFAKEAFQTLNELRKSQTLCDFKIITGKKIHEVHRSVLLTRSMYFREFFTINPLQKEMNLGESVEEGVQCCIEFMYTNNISVTLENIGEVFNVSLAFQLEEVTKMCRDIFMSDLTSENCLIIKRLAEKFKTDLLNKFGIADLETKAEKFAISNFSTIIETEPFLKTPTKELIRFVSFEQSPLNICNSLSRWVTHDFTTRRLELITVLKSVNLAKFSCQDMLLMANSKEFMSSTGVMECLCYEVLKRGNCFLTAENWTGLRELAIKFNIKDLEIKVNKFVLENFSTITQNVNFYKTDKFSLIYFLKAIGIAKSSERIIWDTIVKWTKFHEERRNCFADIMKTVCLSKFSFEFIKNTVKNEPLINQDNDCLKMVIEALCSKPH